MSQYSHLTDREFLSAINGVDQKSPIREELRIRLERLLDSLDQIHREAHNMTHLYNQHGNLSLLLKGPAIPEDILLSSQVQEALAYIEDFRSRESNILASVQTMAFFTGMDANKS